MNSRHAQNTGFKKNNSDNVAASAGIFCVNQALSFPVRKQAVQPEQIVVSRRI